jgi:formylglycine-generating enzyme required for sulfatase activity
MNTTKKLMTLVTLLLMGWLMPLNAFAANTTGDANNDGEVNIADINVVIDVILGGGSNAAADVNGDGEINIADINAIIDIILGGSAPTPSGIETITVNGVSFNMVTVEGGTFTMGAADDDTEAFDSDKPAHQVTLSSYSIGQTEVTQALWLAVMGNNPSYFTSVNGFTDDLNRPVEMVSWDDCQEFITKLNQMTGKTFRLPTEAEWEYAARGGNKSQGYTYAGSNNLGDVAWYRDNAFSVGSSSPDYGTHAVATKSPNELGLYDMSGNVGEWCHDWWGDYSNDAQTNPIGPTSGVTRLHRGGCWGNIARYCRVSIRRGMPQSNSDQPLGLRLVINSNVVVDDDHEWVDLGLPSGTLWATCNIGATKPEDYGDYFAWGETQPKQVYDWSNYKWGNYYVQGGLSKYVTTSEHGTVDYKTELEPEDDAASVHWGPAWRMPSQTQQQELAEKCSWTWTTMNDVNGYMVTGPNGNTLFLPAAGSYEGSSNYDEGSAGDYWSRSLRVNLAIYSFTFHLYGGYYGNVNLYEETRERGLSVRAVRLSPDDLYIEQQSLDLGVVPVGETCTGELTIVNCTKNSMTLTLNADAPFSFNQEEGSASSITVVIPSNTRDTVAVMFTATTPGEFNGNVTIQNSAFEGGQRAIPVHARALTDDFPQHEYVDLGLPSGTLWATMNIGASSPEEYGDYFAWGEIAPKEDYTWETYKWCDGTIRSLTKYCIDSYYGLVDHKFELEPADDAAYMNWGPLWRMPTKEQLDELFQYCTWQRTSRGYQGTGPNGNTLFLPDAGYYDGSTIQFAGYYSFYWSGMLNAISSCNACCTYSMLSNYSRKRYNGLPVRAVRASHD